jgi:uncharacterized RDD family membrane protein YckC
MSPHQPSAFSRFGENHSIETPEQTRLEFAVAGIGSRFLALALDLIIQTLVALVLVIAAAMIGVSGLRRLIPQGSLWSTAVLIALFFVLQFGYFAIFEILWSGQTPGKRNVGIRVVKDSGRPLTAAETIGRNLLRIVDQFPGFYVVAIVTALLNSQNKRLGDFVAGSLVIRESSLAELRPDWPDSHTTQAPSLLGADRLSIEDLTLLETFLARRSELPADVRSRMADGILLRLKQRPPSSIESQLSTESILERLAYERRSRGSSNKDRRTWV